MTTTPPAWGVRYALCLPAEDAARAAAAELAGRGHRLTAVRAHAPSGTVPSSPWQGTTSLDPELAGWWQVFSLAVYGGAGRDLNRLALQPFLRGERLQVAHIARTHGGFQQGAGEGHADTLERVFPRDGLTHEHPTAEVPLPTPLPTDPIRPPAGPSWPLAGIGDPTEVVRAVVTAAEQTYGSAEDAPDAVGWLLDEEFAFGEPYETAAEFLGDLVDAVAHQGTCTAATAEAVPFLAHLARDEDLPDGTRILLLGDLLRLAATAAATAVSLADRTAALGATRPESAGDHLTRQAITRELPSLLARWPDETDATRFALAALAAACDDQNVPLPPRLNELPAPSGTTRADVLSLVTALLTRDDHAVATALNQVSSWHPRAQEKAAGPHALPRDVALAILPDLAMCDVGQGN
ncbi:hypothetical protein [Streptomyces sp. NPDC001530]|uniref:hypothetical protein n=1 Tax=Streptomyces sp. NPDC001530 TaxID=3364582 RepID=UPI003676ADFB